MSRAYFRRLAFVSIVLSFFCAFGVGVDAQTKKERQKSDNLVKEGNSAFDKKDFRGAVDKYAQAVVSNSKNANAHYLKGRAHYFLGEYEPAVSELSAALEKGHKPVEVYRIRWEAHRKLKAHAEALADVEQIIRLEPNNSSAYLGAVAELNLELGKFQEAANAYEKIIAQNPNKADNYYMLARAKSRLGDTEGQAIAAQEAIKRNTQYLADSLLLLASARHAQKRIPEAIDAYSRALASRPDKLESYLMLAELYRTQNQMNEALKILEEGRRLNATNGEVYKELSRFYSLAGKNEEAIASGRSAAQLLPEDPVAHTHLCRAYYQSGKLELAVGACNTALKFAPEYGESLFYLGRLHRALNKPADAEKFYHRAVTSLLEATTKKPEDPDAFYMLGNAYADLQQNARAVEAYNRVLELNPKFPRTYYNIGIIKIIEKDKPGALQQYNALLSLDKSLADRLKAEIDKL